MSSNYREWWVNRGGVVVPVYSVEEWAREFNRSEETFEDGGRRVGLDDLGNVRVSTVFLGLNHQWNPNGPPLIFETMIFGGPHDDYMERYTTIEEARAGHAKAVELAKSGTQTRGQHD